MKHRNAVYGRSAEMLYVKIGALRGSCLEAPSLGQDLIMSFIYRRIP